MYEQQCKDKIVWLQLRLDEEDEIHKATAKEVKLWDKLLSIPKSQKENRYGIISHVSVKLTCETSYCGDRLFADEGDDLSRQQDYLLLLHCSGSPILWYSHELMASFSLHGW